MNPERWKRVRELFLATSELPLSERQSALEAACEGDSELMFQVRRLLGVEQAGDFLEPPDPGRLAGPLLSLAGPGTGTTLGNYRLGAVLGSGGMGVVYRAVDLSNERPVAVKVLPPSLHMAPESVERFKREARAAARLEHPNIVSVLDFGRAEGRDYYAMELVDGPSIAELLEALRAGTRSVRGRAVPLDLSEARACADLAALLAEALEHAHSRGVLHRDVKPHNVLIDPSGAPRLVDFGLARDLAASGITQTGAVAGTPHYMSPEQARSELERIDHRTDIYSLGVVLYELLTLRRPFEGGSAQEIYYKIVHSRSAPARRVNPRVPRALSLICEKAMRRDPARRYASAAHMAADLRRWLAGEPIQARPPGLVERARERLRQPRALLRLAPVVLLLGLAAGWLWRENRVEAALRADQPRLTLRLPADAGQVAITSLSPGPVPGTWQQPHEIQHGPARTRELALEPGPVLLRLRAADGRTAELTRDLEPGERADLDVRLSAAAQLEGMVAVPATTLRVSKGKLAQRDVVVDVQPFLIDRDLVSNAQYARYLEETRLPAPNGWRAGLDTIERSDWERLPVHNLTYSQARAYAEWAGKRLPSPWEWLAVCGADALGRPAKDLLAPGANAALGGLAFGGSAMVRTSVAYLTSIEPVSGAGVAPQGPYGLHHLIGNLTQWVETPYWSADRDGRLRIDERMHLAMGRSWWMPPSMIDAPPQDCYLVVDEIHNCPDAGLRLVKGLDP